MRKNGSLFNNTRMLLAAGLALIVFLSACSAPDIRAIKLVYEKADYAVNALGIDEVRIKARNMPVKVTSSDVDDIAIHYYTCEEDPYEVSLDGSTLTLKYLNENLSQSTDTNPHVEVIVPTEYSGAFQLDTSNDTVNVSGLNSVRNVHINTSNSPIDMEHVTAAQVTAQTSNGAITLDEVSVSGAVDVKSSNGTLSARQVTAGDKLSMITSNGRISIDQAASAVFELSTSNSSISGSVKGKRSDYTITSGTSNGVNNLGTGGKGALVLTAHTSNGNINIRFLGE